MCATLRATTLAAAMTLGGLTAGPGPYSVSTTTTRRWRRALPCKLGNSNCHPVASSLVSQPAPRLPTSRRSCHRALSLSRACARAITTKPRGGFCTRVRSPRSQQTRYFACTSTRAAACTVTPLTTARCAFFSWWCNSVRNSDTIVGRGAERGKRHALPTADDRAVLGLQPRDMYKRVRALRLIGAAVVVGRIALVDVQ